MSVAVPPRSEGWTTAALVDLCDIVIGRTPSRSRPEFWDGDLPWLSIADMSQGRDIRKTKERITSAGAMASGSRLIPSGTVLLSFKLSIGKVAVSAIDTFTNEAIAALPILNPKKLSRDFLFWTLRSIRLDAEVDVAAKGKTLNKSKLERLRIPLPPIDDQRRIVAVLDKVEELRCQRQESLQLTERLVHSVFLDMFVRNAATGTWPTRAIEWMANERKGAIRTGPFGSQLLHSEFVDRGIAVLGIDNAVNNRFEWGQSRFISPTKYQSLQRYKVFPGDLIITIMGTLGRCAIVPDDIPEAINTKHLCCITLDHKKCIPEFIQACLLHHPDVLRQLGVRTKGAVMPGLNMGIIKSLELALPPIKLQQQFKRVIEATNVARVDLEQSQESLENLFGVLQQRAFRGELDLGRLVLGSQRDSPPALVQEISGSTPITPEVETPFLQVPPAVEAVLQELDKSVSRGEAIPWSAEFFKYRILGAQSGLFSFGEVMQKAESVFDEAPPYEDIKDVILELLGRGGGGPLLIQCFDEGTEGNPGRKEILFRPAQ